MRAHQYPKSVARYHVIGALRPLNHPVSRSPPNSTVRVTDYSARRLSAYHTDAQPRASVPPTEIAVRPLSIVLLGRIQNRSIYSSCTVTPKFLSDDHHYIQLWDKYVGLDRMGNDLLSGTPYPALSVTVIVPTTPKLVLTTLTYPLPFQSVFTGEMQGNLGLRSDVKYVICICV
jgi:hypothetical protein